MKTQITNLINAQSNVKRDLNAIKYTDLRRGSSYKKRGEIAKKVIAENGEILNITINGVDLILKMQRSESNKTISYSSLLTIEQYLKITDLQTNPFIYETLFLLEISNDMRVTININTRKRLTSKWRWRRNETIGEEFVIIK